MFLIIKIYIFNFARSFHTSGGKHKNVCGSHLMKKCWHCSTCWILKALWVWIPRATFCAWHHHDGYFESLYCKQSQRQWWQWAEMIFAHSLTHHYHHYRHEQFKVCKIHCKVCQCCLSPWTNNANNNTITATQADVLPDLTTTATTWSTTWSPTWSPSDWKQEAFLISHMDTKVIFIIFSVVSRHTRVVYLQIT